MSVLVCVTGQKNCDRLIVAGSSIAQKGNDYPLTVLHVARIGGSLMGFVNEPEALEYLLRASIEHGADMMVRRADDVLNAIEAEARRLDADVIVAGRAANYSGWDMLDELKARLPGVRFEIRGA